MMQNFDVRMREQEYQVQKEAASGERLNMLPSLVAGSDVTARDEYYSVASKNTVTGAETVPQSISSEKESRALNFEMAWGVLDFGLTYYRARQADSRRLIAMQDFTRLKQNVILEITSAYWKAIVAKSAKSDAEAVLVKVEKRQASLEKQISNRTIPEIEGLSNKKLLLEMRIKLQNYERELRRSKAKLAALVGMPPDADFVLAEAKLSEDMGNVWEVKQLEETALHSRPELFSQDLRGEIASDEVRAAILRMFPNARLFGRYDYDANRFLLHNDWYSIGMRATWDLLRLPSLWAKKDSAQAAEKGVYQARLSLSVGILAQVHLAYLNLMDAKNHYKLAAELEKVKLRLLEAGRKEQKSGEYDSEDVLKLEAEALFARVYKMTTYSEFQVALERLGNTIGKPLAFSSVALPAGMHALACDSKHREEKKKGQTAEETEESAEKQVEYPSLSQANNSRTRREDGVWLTQKANDDWDLNVNWSGQ
jgi:outer membrane protein TolC